MVSGPIKSEKRGSFGRDADKDVLAFLCQPPTAEIEVMLGTLAWQKLTVAYCHDPYDDYVLLPDIYFGCLFAGMLGGHNEQSKKDLHGLIYADICKQRLDANVSSVQAMLYDVDGWLPFDEVGRRRDGLAGLSWTTFNHRKRRSTISAHDIVEWRRKRRVRPWSPLTDDEARHFLREYNGGKKAYLTNLRVLERGEPQQVKERGKPKTVYCIEHDPEEKSRSLCLLKEPINLAEVGQDGYRAIYHAVGVGTYGTAPNGAKHYDESCANPSRIHWNPAHKDGAEDFHVRLHMGEPLDWRPIWERIVKDIEARRVVARKRASERLAAPPVALAEIAHALKSIPPSIGRKEWFSAICGIYNASAGSEEGRELAHEWSSGDPYQYDPDDLDNNIWDRLSVDREGGATMGTLIFLAKKYDKDFRTIRGVRHGIQINRNMC